MCVCPTIRLKNKVDGRVVLFNVEDAPELCKNDWEVLEPKDESILETAKDDAEPEVSSDDDAESTPEDAKKIDELIAEAEAEKVIEPDVPPEISPDEAKKLAESQQPEQPKQSEQPEKPATEDDVIMPAE